MMISRRLGAGLIGVVLGVALSTGAYAQAVLQSVSVKVKPGMMATYQERVATLQGALDRAGAGGRVQLWNATVAGTNVGNTLVSVSFPSLAAFAESTTKTGADPEWQKIMAGLDDIRTVISQSLLVSRDGSEGPLAAASGSVLQGVLLRVNPGQLDEYLSRVASLKKAQERVGSSGNMRVWQATLAGENTGTVAVGIIHPSLAEYAANTGKIQADAEAQKLLNGLDGIRTLVSTSLFTSP